MKNRIVQALLTRVVDQFHDRVTCFCYYIEDMQKNKDQVRDGNWFSSGTVDTDSG